MKIPKIPCDFKITYGSKSIRVIKHKFKPSFVSMFGCVMEEKCKRCDEFRHRITLNSGTLVMTHLPWMQGPMYDNPTWDKGRKEWARI